MRTCAGMEALRGSAVQLVSQHLELHVVSAVNEVLVIVSMVQDIVIRMLYSCVKPRLVPRRARVT